MIAKAVVWQLVGADRTRPLYRGRHGILLGLLLFKPLFAKALNLAAVCGFAVHRAKGAINFSGEARGFKFNIPRASPGNVKFKLAL